MKKKSAQNRSGFSRFFSALFGEFSWNSPPWVGSAARGSTARPVLFWGSLVGILILFVASTSAYIWYKNQPKPNLPEAVVTAPKITPITEEDPVPDDLTVDFVLKNEQGNINPKSVAPLQNIGKEVEDGISISPQIAGKWYWESDNKLKFTPQNDWAAGQTYTIHFTKEFFAPEIHMGSLDYSFSTQPFQAEIGEFKFYQDPVNPNVRQAVATVQFNYPVEPESLEDKTHLSLQALKDGKLDPEAEQFKYSITYDTHKRIAYIHSETISLKDEERYLILTINKGVKAADNTQAETKVDVSKNLLIPDISNYFKVAAANATIVRNEQDLPEQVLTVETSTGVNEAEIKKGLHVYILPTDYPATAHEEAIKNYEWHNPGEVTASILALAKPLALQPIPAENNYALLHSFKFNAHSPNYIYIKIDKGTRGFGDYTLTQDYQAVLLVPEYPKEISFIHKGALLALNSEKKLSVLVRGLPAVKFEFARVLPQNVNQLITQTEGDFNNPYFMNQSFNQQNISEIFSEVQQFNSNDNKAQYSALDFNRYLSTAANTGGPQGLFLLQANGWDVENQTPLDARASRLVLITDLGLVVKDNQDGSHDVFVQSITQGTPQPNVVVSILGKNGLPIFSNPTDLNGRAHFPTLKDYINERQPVVYLASLGNDVSFIPYNNSNRQLNYTRYDVGGIYTNSDQTTLSAYLFSDRGIYRPGDTAHIGMIVKQTFVQPQPAGLTLEATVVDPRGATVLDKKFTLDDLGYLTFDFPTQPASPTGQYYISLYTVKDEHAESLIGSTNVKVEEFQPDRMRIKSHLSTVSEQGWVSPENLSATVELWNLYGAPAAGRRVSGKILLQPKPIEFRAYPDFIFADPLIDPKKPGKVFTDNLPDGKTNDKGMAEFKLNLERFDKATYQLTFFAEGFESEGGRSVATSATTLVSPLSYFVGYKPDGDLHFIKQSSTRSVQFIAVNPELKQMAVGDLKLQLVRLQPVSTLVKNPNGTFQYQSIIQSKVISTQPFTLSESGTVFNLPTQEIGDFGIHILDKDNTELSKLQFSIVGQSQVPLAKNAELNIKLDKETYKAGEDIELQITAPYIGAGLITIERDKVYAVQWFKADTTSSVQKIHIPEDLQGNAYINVAFVRDWNSPDIFMNPLSYSVVPFSIDHAAHEVGLRLDIPELAKPGEPFKIEYASDKPGKVIVFAVDEGILQVARYEAPDPLGFFFQKRALEVLTQQTVDQILPQYIRERELSAVGGDGGEDMLSKYLNPFKRKTDLPVAFWSGIVDVDSIPRQLTYDIPDYFNGTLHVMAVAVSLDSLGTAEKTAEVRGDFVINPNVPTFVAPGDVFEITASIANNVKNSGNEPKIYVQLHVSPELEILDSATTSVVIQEGKEQTVRFKLRAKSLLGAARMTLEATLGDKSSAMDATLSVRPATPFYTSIQSGYSKDAKKLIPLDRDLFAEERSVEAAISSSPLILAAGMLRYLDNYPYGCTEQLVSKAMPLLAMTNQPWFASDLPAIQEKVAVTMQMVSQRQMSNGGISYWPGVNDDESNRFSSVYALHFLTEAKDQGYQISNEVLSTGLGYLKELVTQAPKTLDEARVQAYAIYILTRNEMVTTNYLTNLQLYLDKEQPQKWQQDLTGSYIAATYQMLKSSREANALISQYKSDSQPTEMSYFYDRNIGNAQYLYLVAKHFPEKLAKVSEQFTLPLVQAINNDDISTLLSSYTSIALSAAAGQSNTGKGFKILEILKDNTQKTLLNVLDTYGKAEIDVEAKEVMFANPQQNNYFYQVTQAGFDQNLPQESQQQGLEIHREYRDAAGNIIDQTTLGSEVEVHIQVRALKNFIYNAAIVDLLPGGFEVVLDSVHSDYIDYIDIREDRVLFFGGIDTNAQELVYKIKAINTGEFTVPPIMAESMYDPSTKGFGKSGKLMVNKAR